MKKIVIFAVLFLITGCTTEYNLSYEDEVFKENITIKDYYNDGDGEGEPDIEYYKNEEIYHDINNLKTFDVSIDRNFNGSYDMSFDAVYDEVSYKDAVIFNNCMQFYEYDESDSSIYISVYGDYYCYGFEELKINFTTDKKVTYSNHHEKENGKYTWVFDYGEKIDIEIEIDKLVNRGFDYSIFYYIFGFILVCVLVVLGIVIYKKYRSNKEV